MRDRERDIESKTESRLWRQGLEPHAEGRGVATPGPTFIGHSLLQLQRQHGNRYVQRMVAHGLAQAVQHANRGIQRKLVVGSPGDRFEQEAEQVARQFMASEVPAIEHRTGAATLRRRPLETDTSPARTGDDAEASQEEGRLSTLRFRLTGDDLETFMDELLPPFSFPLPTGAPAAESKEQATPQLPERISVFSKSWLDIGLRLGLPKPKFEAPGEREKSFEDALRTAEVREARFKSGLQTLTGKIPTGLDALDLEKTARTAWSILSSYIAPDVAKGLSSVVSAPVETGEISIDLDLAIMLEEKGGGLNVTVSYPSLTELLRFMSGR